MQARRHNGLSYRAGGAIGIAALAALGGWMVFYELHWQADAGPFVENGALTGVQEQSIKVMLDLFQLLMTWALAIIGATAFFLKLNVEKDLPLRQVDLLLSLAIIGVSVLSLFFGHLGIDRTSQLLALQQFPVANEGLRQIGKLQYLCFFAAVLMFGFHIFRFFWARVSSPEAVAPRREPL